MRVLSRRYAKMGIATLRIDFKGHGDRKDEAEGYSPISMTKDAITSLNWLDSQLPEIKETIACGFSTGGGIAITLRALDDRVSKCCLLYPVLSFKHNFLAAVYPDDLILPLKKWDNETIWRKIAFPEAKLNASLNDNADFELSAHTYGADFIKDCKTLIDTRGDIDNFLISKKDRPVTIIQGSYDQFVPHLFAQFMYSVAKKLQVPVSLYTMKGMNHFVPTEWKASVIKQFKYAALTDPKDFKPRHVTVRIHPQINCALPRIQPL